MHRLARALYKTFPSNQPHLPFPATSLFPSYRKPFTTMTSGAASNETTPAAASIAHNSPSSSAIITPTSLRSTLTERLAAEYVEVDDISGTYSTHFTPLTHYTRSNPNPNQTKPHPHNPPPPRAHRQRKRATLTILYGAAPHGAEGCGQSFEATIVSSLFEKKRTLARHRLVNAALKIEIAAIHAWTPRCFTPEEWKRRKQEEQGNLGS